MEIDCRPASWLAIPHFAHEATSMKCRRSDLSDSCFIPLLQVGPRRPLAIRLTPSHPRAIAWQHRLGLSFWGVLLEFARGLSRSAGRPFIVRSRPVDGAGWGEHHAAQWRPAIGPD
jgi:hypothetical protein